MVYYLIVVTACLLCSLSMIFTGLFAFYISSPQTADLVLSNYFSLMLMVVVGLSIDLCKYIFWEKRAEHYTIFSLALLLAGFSWAASVAFFVSQSFKQEESERKGTVAYRQYEYKIKSLKQDILFYEQLTQKHLNSRYHTQWEKGRESRKDVNQLNRSLSEALEKEPFIGVDEIRQKSPAAAFFYEIARLIGWSFNAVSFLAYACLAALIESCSFAMLSLERQKYKQGVIDDDAIAAHYKKQKTRDKHESQLVLMKEHIVNGSEDPKVGELSKQYELRYPIVKSLLDSLVNQGVLEKQANRYIRVTN